LEVLVGAGGWDYLPAAGVDGLRAYSGLFRFVEVNTTFYHLPRLGAVRSWRRRVPGDFVFSVKCNGMATHVHGLRPVDETFVVLERMLSVCRLLLSDMLVLQTPPSLAVDEAKISEVSKILRNVGVGQVQAFWEARNPVNPEDKRKMQMAMLDDGIIPVVDLSREDPPPETRVIYSRLFNSGGSEYSDVQMEKIRGSVSRSGAEKVVLAFHGARMYRDAKRYMELNRE